MMSDIRWKRLWPVLAVAGLTLAFGPGVSNAATASAAASAAPTSQTLYAVSCVPVSGTAYCWAVGASGTILVSYDDGRYWFRQYSGTTADLRGVTFVSATQGWAVGAAGTILDTTDGGAIWSMVGTSSPTALTFNAVACQTMAQWRCWAVGSGVAAIGTPPTSPWTLRPIAGTGGTCAGTGNACVNGVAFTTYDEHFAAGGGGSIFRQFDYVSPGWSAQLSLGAGYFAAISCLSAPPQVDHHGLCIAVGTNPSFAGGWIYYTSDSGSTWLAAAGTQPRLNGVSIPPYYGNEAVAVGYGGTILRTSNGGASWAASPSPIGRTLYGVSCPAGTGVDCVAVGAHGAIVRTAP